MKLAKKVVPNAISLLRIVLLWPLFILFPSYPFLTLLLFFIAVLTDWLDGFVARKLGSESRIGQIIDPVADKFLYLGMLYILSVKIFITLLIFELTLPLEAMLTAIRFWPLNKILHPYIPATDIGKMKMVLQSTAIICLLFGLTIDYWPIVFEGILIGFLSILFSLASLWSHFSHSEKI